MSDIEYSVIKNDVIKSFDCTSIKKTLNIFYKTNDQNIEYNLAGMFAMCQN